MTTITKKHTDAAIIGFWRQGCNVNEIAGILEVSTDYAKQVIHEYKLQIKFYKTITNV